MSMLHKNPMFTVRKPFDAVLALAHHPTGAGHMDSVWSVRLSNEASRTQLNLTISDKAGTL
jgi:hypothetical protein